MEVAEHTARPGGGGAVVPEDTASVADMGLAYQGTVVQLDVGSAVGLGNMVTAHPEEGHIAEGHCYHMGEVEAPARDAQWLEIEDAVKSDENLVEQVRCAAYEAVAQGDVTDSGAVVHCMADAVTVGSTLR